MLLTTEVLGSSLAMGENLQMMLSRKPDNSHFDTDLFLPTAPGLRQTPSVRAEAVSPSHWALPVGDCVVAVLDFTVTQEARVALQEVKRN